ncbi:hypothetical protein [Streptosporangium longisporum]
MGLALALASSGCASEPTLDKAITELQKDMQRLETDDVFKNPLMNLRVLQRPDIDIPCDKEKFKRVLRITADDKRKATDIDSHLDQAEGVMAGTLVNELGYKMEHSFTEGDAEEGRFIHGLKEVGVVVSVYVAPEAPTWRLHAETSCLPK